MAEEEHSKKQEPLPEPKQVDPEPEPEKELESETKPKLEAPKDVEVETIVPGPAEEKPADDLKALTIVEKPAEGTKPDGSLDRDALLARVATEKRLSLIKAWEESEKSKAENKAQKKLSSIGAWENSKKAQLEAELKKIEEMMERKKAEWVERMRNKIALVHKAAEEKRAGVEAKRGEDLLKAEETAAKYRATGTAPKKSLIFF